MEQLLNTLFVQTEGLVLSLEQENVVIKKDQVIVQRIPLHHLGSIAVLGRVILTSPLIAKCAADGRSIAYFNEVGKYQYRIEGPVSGNILLRQAQFQAHENEDKTILIAKTIVIGKISNCRNNILRIIRENKLEVEGIKAIAAEMKRDMQKLLNNDYTLDEVRGIEGMNARRYFSVFNEWIKQERRNDFVFERRTRRPPLDRVNAALSFAYSLMLSDVTAAVQGTGMDHQLGFLHALRPGRPALALDLLEEFRPLCDRLIFSLINRQQLSKTDFIKEAHGNGAVYLNDQGRKKVIVAYQEHKKREIMHPVLKRNVQYGLIPHIQARLFARYLREDQSVYIPFTYR
ncbi:MAG: type I-C CRISPR-associated endonuclease Cas1c [Ectobacillus sp.]